MRETIRTIDDLVRENRYLMRQLAAIARIAGYDWPSNDEEHGRKGGAP